MNAALRYPNPDCSAYGEGADVQAGWEADSAARSSAALLRVLAVGTGGQCDWQFVASRRTLGYPITNVVIPERVPAYPVGTAADDLKQVKALFQASVSDLAALFGVTRQTIYDWLGGEQQPREGHRTRMAALLAAASALEAAGFGVSRRALKQPLSDGRTLLDAVRAGGSLEDATGELIDLFRQEARQREALKRRLADRSGAPVDLADLGAPHLREDL